MPRTMRLDPVHLSSGPITPTDTASRTSPRTPIGPDAINGRAPGARWIKAGLWAGAGVFVALSLSHRGDIAALVQWLRPA